MIAILDPPAPPEIKEQILDDWTPEEGYMAYKEFEKESGETDNIPISQIFPTLAGAVIWMENNIQPLNNTYYIKRVF